MDKNNQDLLAQEKTALAAERTFSAWLRTGLAGFAVGLAIVRFIFFKNPLNRLLAHFAGQLLILWSIGLFVMAFIEYRLLLKRLRQRHGYSVSLIRLTVIITPLCIIAALLLWVIL